MMPRPAAQTEIRSALSAVASLRDAVQGDAAWSGAVAAVKAFQCERFARHYAPMRADPRQGAALEFFLSDLYAARDFSQRDAQFSRIAPAIERLFPAEVAATALALAEVHALSERLDAALARAWLASGEPQLSAQAYVRAWREVGEPESRTLQLRTVLNLGRALERHTATRGLRTLLKMMRGPAAAAGLSDLQGFLERGFDTFKALGDATPFLSHIERCEGALLRTCFHASEPAAVALLEGSATA